MQLRSALVALLSVVLLACSGSVSGVASPESHRTGDVGGAIMPKEPLAGHGGHRGPHKVDAQQGAAAAAVPPFRAVVDDAGFLIPQTVTSDAACVAVVGVFAAFGALLTALLYSLL
jgi:hypothetical protein